MDPTSAGASAKPELSVLGQPSEDTSASTNAPAALELVLLTGANLLCMVALQWRKESAVLRTLPEQTVAIIVGMVLGGITVAVGYEDLSETILYSFSGIFFDFLLPAIIFSNAFSIKNKSFFRNMTGILCFSLLGTALSSVLIGLGVYAAFQTGIVRHFPHGSLEDTGAGTGAGDLALSEHERHPNPEYMPLVDCLILGSLLSAVDPGAVLSVLPATIDRQIYAFLFGESVLNSAVAVVLYNGFRMYHHVLVMRGNMDDLLWPDDLLMLMSRFVVITVLSMAAGVAIGLLSALTLKRFPQLHESPGREQAVLLLFAYLSYLAPRQIGLSPVVALFFCGATMTHYSYYNLSRMSQVATSSWFKTIGHVAETFVFVFLGASLFSVKESEWHPDLILILVVLCVASRFFHIFFLAGLINAGKWVWSHYASWSQWWPCRCLAAARSRFPCKSGEGHGGSFVQPPVESADFAGRAYRYPPQYISWRAQLFLSLAGLRGAVAFALGLHAPVLNQEGQMVTTTISVVLFTYIVQGSVLYWAARSFHLVGDDLNSLAFHHKQRKQRLNGLSSPSAILRLGMSPHSVHLAANFASVDDRRNSPQDMAGEVSEDALAANASRYGTFTGAWRRFDDSYMKPIFGGKLRMSVDESETNSLLAAPSASTVAPGEIDRLTLEGLISGNGARFGGSSSENGSAHAGGVASGNRSREVDGVPITGEIVL